MEAHRLKPMTPGYDVTLFNELYQKTADLRKKLVKQIDTRRFGVDFDEMMSWFDVKFIFVFNKYHLKFDREVLLGHIINALTLYKYRVLRQAYTNKAMMHLGTVSFESYHSTDSDPDDDYLIELAPAVEINPVLESHSSPYYTALIQFLKHHISDDALYLFEFELHPSPYIYKRMNELGCKSVNKIPDPLILEYFGIGDSPESYRYLYKLRNEIRKGIELAKKHFRNSN